MGRKSKKVSDDQLNLFDLAHSILQKQPAVQAYKLTKKVLAVKAGRKKKPTVVREESEMVFRKINLMEARSLISGVHA